MIDVAIDVRMTRRMSAGQRAYVVALLDALPRVAPDVHVLRVGHGENMGIAEQIDLPLEIAHHKPALTHYPTIYAPLYRRRPYLVNVHDLIHLELPKLFGWGAALYYTFVAQPMLRGAARLLTPDQRTALMCETLLGVPRERICIVPLGYDPVLLEPPDEPLRPARPYLFYAGNHRPHKNLGVLYQAWASLPAAIELDLVCTGSDDPAARSAFVRANGTLRFLGEIAPRELARRYRAAFAYVHPALVEGFGLPMLEALVLGTPVIASATAVPTIVAPYATTFPATDVLALRATLTDLAANPAPFRRRAAEGSTATRAYTWDRCAAATAAVYREVADGSVGT